MTTQHKLLSLVCCAALALQACKKDGKKPSNGEDDILPPSSHQLEVNFKQGSIDVNKIDSVTVVMQKTGDAPQTSKKLTKGTGMYYIDGLNLENSTWKASLTVYTTKATDNQASHVYNIEKQINKTLLVDAPTGKLSNAWSPRLMVNDPISKVQFIVAERQDDPYFAINAITPTDWEYIYLERAIENAQGTPIETMVYEKYEGDVFPNNKNVVNTTFFTPYCNKMKDKNWEVGSIFIMMFKKGKPNEDITLLHRYNKRAE